MAALKTVGITMGLAVLGAATAAAQSAGTVMASVTVIDVRPAQSAARVAVTLASGVRRAPQLRRDAGGATITTGTPESALRRPGRDGAQVTITFW